MSPHLFLLCMEYLSHLLMIKTRTSDFQYHAKCASNSITHLAFADNLLVFARGDLASIRVMAKALEEFSLTLGLRINKRKSNIFMIGVRPYEKEQILGMFDFRLPLSARRLNIHHYSPLIDQIMACINRWANTNLSLAGRMELARSVLQGVECYWI